jgi:hypothetical protein
MSQLVRVVLLALCLLRPPRASTRGGVGGRIIIRPQLLEVLLEVLLQARLHCNRGTMNVIAVDLELRNLTLLLVSLLLSR